MRSTVKEIYKEGQKRVSTFLVPMDVGDATSTTSMDVVKVGLEKQVGLELEGIQG